ncbi:Crp/Fnr family transcriptional regulator [Saccharothrix coeruleofusca]|uniref:Crp/Fnr family transcriptional regulator n=1 Tax=Saccharothrix coeruleofusca TaxID=33919 RepID=A0A918AKL1_9PSEU|nr:Crp/Fnr family transcriptional regulator [Saccharothrix coeruleofusca]MBP2338132.1 CRP-like cAMP-binding protein [Saccharothrix coeruleofusca]GGP50549.1 Crp/Fnr family transcriptional regulator [Saccharothrix coeruleofusca]
MTVIPPVRVGRWPTGTFMDMLAPPAQEALLRLGRPKKFRRGDVLMHELDESDEVVLLCRTLVKATISLDNGRVALLNIKVGGDVVGEMAALSGDPRSATITVCADGHGRVFTAAQFRDYLREHPDANLALSRMIMQTLRWADKRRVDFNGYPALVRLARVLVELCNHYGRSGQDGVTLDLGLTQRELGALVGAEEDTARKELRVLRDRGVISMGYRTITVLDRVLLDGIARDSGKPGDTPAHPRESA